MKRGTRIGIFVVCLSVLLLGALFGYYTWNIFRHSIAEWVPTEQTALRLNDLYDGNGSYYVSGYLLLDGEAYYPLPYDWHKLAHSGGKTVARRDGDWLSRFWGDGLLERPPLDEKEEFLYESAFRDGTLYAKSSAIERMQQGEQTLTGIYVEDEAEIHLTDPAALALFQQLESLQGETVRYTNVGSAAYSYQINYLYNDLPILHWQATIARVDGRFVYVPLHTGHSDGECVGVVIEDPQPLLDLRVEGKPVFTLEDRQGTALS